MLPFPKIPKVLTYLVHKLVIVWSTCNSLRPSLRVQQRLSLPVGISHHRQLCSVAFVVRERGISPGKCMTGRKCDIQRTMYTTYNVGCTYNVGTYLFLGAQTSQKGVRTHVPRPLVMQRNSIANPVCDPVQWPSRITRKYTHHREGEIWEGQRGKRK